MKLLKKIYHIFIKKDVVFPFYFHKFGEFGKNSILYKPLYIKNKKDIFIGNNTTILNNARIQTYNELTKLNSRVKIGNNCYLGYNVSILAGEEIIIDDGVLIASNVFISSYNHAINPEDDKYYSSQLLKCNPVYIGEGSWIGEKVSILAGTKIGKKCVIGAGSVVTKNIPDYTMAVGTPAKVIKKYNFNTHKWENKGE